MHKRQVFSTFWLGVCLALAGCADGASLNPAMFALITGSVDATKSPTTVYARIARGAQTCWLGPRAPLHGSHLFRAKAEPASRGGAAEVKIYERVPGQKLGLVAFSVAIAGSRSPSPGLVTTHNRRFTKSAAQRMDGDIRRWVRGEISCRGRISGQWPAALHDQPASKRK